jgi:hypothetical protein
VSRGFGQHRIVKAVDQLDQSHVLTIQVFIVHTESWLPSHEAHVIALSA